jgi:hypothetical protein
MGKAATEATFVVYLGVTRQTDSLPDVDQKRLGIPSPAVAINLSGRITGDDIKGIEAEDLLSTLQVMGHVVDLADLMSLGRV